MPHPHPSPDPYLHPHPNPHAIPARVPPFVLELLHYRHIAIALPLQVRPPVCAQADGCVQLERAGNRYNTVTLPL